MSKFETKDEIRRSLEDGLTLMEGSMWVQFHEIETYKRKGLTILNPEKRDLYEKKFTKKNS